MNEDKPPAVILIKRPKHRDMIYPIVSTNQALEVLADRRLEAFWPKILAFYGTDLKILRDVRLSEIKRITGDGSTKIAMTAGAAAVGPSTRATLLLADELRDAGYINEAIGVVAAERDAAARSQRHLVILNIYAVTSSRLASLHSFKGDLESALAILDESEPALVGDESIINLRITRAAMLAEAGRYAQALAALDAASIGRANIKGSDRQFTWIRACALHGLGRLSTADATSVQLGDQKRTTRNGFIVDSSSSIKLRYALCLRDPAAIASTLVENARSRPFGGEAFILLQPSFYFPRMSRELAERVRSEPTMIKELGDRMRTLPPELSPALNSWRDEAATLAKTP